MSYVKIGDKMAWGGCFCCLHLQLARLCWNELIKIGMFRMRLS